MIVTVIKAFHTNGIGCFVSYGATLDYNFFNYELVQTGFNIQFMSSTNTVVLLWHNSLKLNQYSSSNTKTIVTYVFLITFVWLLAPSYIVTHNSNKYTNIINVT